MARGAEFLGSEVAIMCGAMSWVSERNLVAAMSNAGGFGLIACGAMSPELLDKEIAGTKALTNKAVRRQSDHDAPAADGADRGMRKHNVSHVVLAGGLPPPGSLDAIKANGAKLICFAPALSLAKKLIRSGVDALVVEGMEAGGHIGPVSTSVLAQEICPKSEQVPVFVAGGIGRGEAIAGYLDRARRASSSARASFARPRASPMPISKKRSSGRWRAMRWPASRSIPGSGSFPSAR